MSLRGVIILLRHRLRGRTARELWPSCLPLCAWFAVSALLESGSPISHGGKAGNVTHLWQNTALYLYAVPNFVSRWRLLYLTGAGVLLLPIGGMLGARAVPDSDEADGIELLLRTPLRAFDICLGRAQAGLWPLWAALLVSLAFWLMAGAGQNAQAAGYVAAGQTLTAHFVLASGVYMTGSVGLLFASRRTREAMWGRGAWIAGLLAFVCCGAIILINPLVQRMTDPVRLIDAALLLNPVAGVASALKWDVLRVTWIYAQTDAHEYPFRYPASWATIGVFLSVGTLGAWLASLIMRRAYSR